MHLDSFSDWLAITCIQLVPVVAKRASKQASLFGKYRHFGQRKQASKQHVECVVSGLFRYAQLSVDAERTMAMAQGVLGLIPPQSVATGLRWLRQHPVVVTVGVSQDPLAQF